MGQVRAQVARACLAYGQFALARRRISHDERDATPQAFVQNARRKHRQVLPGHVDISGPGFPLFAGVNQARWLFKHLAAHIANGFADAAEKPRAVAPGFVVLVGLSREFGQVLFAHCPHVRPAFGEVSNGRGCLKHG